MQAKLSAIGLGALLACARGAADSARIEHYGREGTARITQQGSGKSATIIQYQGR
jgi:hypothetical protein